jgi:hypothetical protein
MAEHTAEECTDNRTAHIGFITTAVYLLALNPATLFGLADYGTD